MRKAVRGRILVYGGIVAAVGGFYLYQPVRIDLFPRPAPVPNPVVDPDSKGLFAKGARVALLTAHPDDSEYYAGALLAKLQKTGARVTLVAMTDGDKGFYPWEDAAANRKVRRAEETAAAKAWGAARLVSFDGAYPPKVAHGDHTAAGRIAERAARRAGARWLVHFASHAPNGTFDLSGFDLVHRTLLDLHPSQFSGEKEAAVWGTVFESGLADGERIGAEYGLSVRSTPLPPQGKGPGDGKE